MIQEVITAKQSPYIWTKDKQKIAKSLAHLAFIELCRRDPNAAIPYILSFGNTEPFEQQWFQKEWHEVITNNQWCLIEAPREHGKTNQISIGRTIWDLGKYPELRIKGVTNSDEKGTEIAMTVATHIKSNPRVREIFPDLKPSDEGMWTKSKIYIERDTITKDPSFEACGVLSTGTGGRADILNFDDPVDQRNAIAQPALRKAVKDAYRDVWINLLPPTGRVRYICTPWHKDDLTAELKTEPHWIQIRHEIDEKFTPIWPEKWSTEALKMRLNAIKSRAFARGFRLIVISDEDVIFPREVIESCYTNYELGDIEPGMEFITGVDLGHRSIESGSESFPQTVIYTIGIKNNKKRLVSLRRGKFTSPETARQIVDNFYRFHELAIMIENNAYQDAILQWIHEVYGYLDIPIKAFTTGKNKADEAIGLPSMRVELENKGWEFPNVKNHNKACQCVVCIFVGELNDYPLGKLQDTVMAMWMAREGFRKYCQTRLAIGCLDLIDIKEQTKEMTSVEAITRRLELMDED